MPRKNTDEVIRRRDRWKIIRTILEFLLLGGAIAAAVIAMVNHNNYQSFWESNEGMYEKHEDSVVADLTPMVDAKGTNRFIALSYNGLTTSQSLDSKIVTVQNYERQLEALKNSGYETISQQDVMDFYLYGHQLPEKALLLMFEDGIYNTAVLAQNMMKRLNYKATMLTYAQNLADTKGGYVTGENLKRMLASTFWELGSNGYRLSYINVYDRYENYLGHMNLSEFLAIHDYCKRDYNHYLMDFLRNEDRLREESVEEMEKRIAYDYERMKSLYEEDAGYVPLMYVLMHSNTGAFGNNSLVSDRNKEEMSRIFGMNFNRQGSCLNTQDASIYDLTRLQSRHYFTTNHLLMRIWDDTGDDVVFRVGDAKEAAKWYVDDGVVEFDGDDRINLTTVPYGQGRMVLKDTLVDDVELNVLLQGNVVGRQSIYLRTDRNLEEGVELRLKDNVFHVLDNGKELLSVDLFLFDGGPFISKAENELEGLKAMQKAIIEFDEDEERRMEAETELERLEKIIPVSVEDGGEIYEPELDISMRDERALRAMLKGNRLSVWIDDKAVVENLMVESTSRGNIGLLAEVTENIERFSQANLDDDVYDAVFLDLQLTRPVAPESVYYQYTLNRLNSVKHRISTIWDQITTFLQDNL